MPEPTVWALIIVVAVAVLFGGMIFGIPFYAMWTHHRRKMEEIRGRQKIQIAEETRAAIEALREEFRSLRDTTTQYDVSFDTAMRRLESRMGSLEQRVGQVERQNDLMPIQRG